MTDEEQLANAAKARADYAKSHPLGLDFKLCARLTVVEKKPKLADLLPRMGAAAGLNFTLADNLTHHDPDLGGFNLKNAFTYTFMEIIAERHMDNGRWEKTDAGYRLEGVSRALRPPPPPRKFPWAWLALSLPVILGAAGAFVIYRRRGKKAPKTA